MIQILGIKRIIILLVLAGINAVLAASIYGYVVPQNDKLSRDLQVTRSQISSKRAEADQLRTEYDLILAQKTQFGDLENAGFLSNQNRLEARRRIVDIQKYTQVLQADYSISPARVSEDENATLASHIILTSPMTIDIEAMDDLDFYKFVYWIENAFPGHIAMTRLKIDRTRDINEATLRAIGSGQQVVLVRGTVDFEWKTMVPKDLVEGDESNQFNYNEF